MVVMPEYLMTPSKQPSTKPRIISEVVKKNCLSKLKLSFTTSFQDFGKPKYSGQLLWHVNNSEWVLRTGEVKQGSLILINRETSGVELRQPLRELNLRACNQPKTFCLTEAQGVRLLVFQALNEDEYEKWVRILAAELIRQTPLNNVRFLDILSIVRNKDLDKSPPRKGESEKCIATTKGCQKDVGKPVQDQVQAEEPNKRLKSEEEEEEEEAEGEFKIKKIKVRYQRSAPVLAEREKRQKSFLITQSMNNLAVSADESSFGNENRIPCSETPLSFSFISVRDRKNFFESLNSDSEPTSPLVRSNSVNNFNQASPSPQNMLHRRKRIKSLHDLHKTPVREMCQLFESQDERFEKNTPSDSVERIARRRLERGERKLEKLTNQMAEVEDAIKNVKADMKSMGAEILKRKEGLEVFAGLQKRLDEENSRLQRLKDEVTRVIKGNQRTMLKAEYACNENQY